MNIRGCQEHRAPDLLCLVRAIDAPVKPEHDKV